MKPSGSLYFPFAHDNENECMLRAFTVEDTVLSSIKCFVLTRKGSRVGTNFGSFLPEILLTTISTKKFPEIATELKSELSSQFSGVTFLDVLLTQDLTQQNATIFLSIKLSIATNPNILELNLELPSIFSK